MEFKIKKENTKKIGIYGIFNTSNDKIYIGSTRDSFRRRYKHHLLRLKRKCHGNQHLQNAFNKYGEDSFEFFILEIINLNTNFKEGLNRHLINREIFYVNKYKSLDRNFGYNKTIPEIGIFKHSKETRKKMSNIAKERHRKGEIQITQKGRKLHYSVWNKNKKASEISKGRRKNLPNIEVYDIDWNYIKTFDCIVEIYNYTQNNEHDLPVILHFNSKDRKLRKANLITAINSKKSYKGLNFKKI